MWNEAFETSCTETKLPSLLGTHVLQASMIDEKESEIISNMYNIEPDLDEQIVIQIKAWFVEDVHLCEFKE